MLPLKLCDCSILTCAGLLELDQGWLLPVKGNEEGLAHERSMLQRKCARHGCLSANTRLTVLSDAYPKCLSLGPWFRVNSSETVSVTPGDSA